MEMNYGLKKVINGLQGLKEEPLTEKRDQGQNGQFQSNLEKTIQLVKLFASGFNYLKEEPTQVKGEEKSSSAEKVSAEIVPHVASSSSSSSNHQSIKAEPPMKMPVHQLIPNYIPDSSNKSNQKPGVTLSPKSSSSSNIIEEDVLRHPEKYSPQQRGFLRIKQYLAKLESKMPELVPSVTIKCLKDSNGNDTSSISNVVFKYNNNPMSGWKKEVKLRMAGKTKGKFDVSYINEKYERRLSSKGEVLQFVEEEKLHPSIGEKFDFRSVFCVCQTSEDPCRNFIECSYGFCGCNAWIHPECVGLGARSEEDLQKMKKAICPFCSYYLEGAGQIDQFSKDTL